MLCTVVTYHLICSAPLSPCLLPGPRLGFRPVAAGEGGSGKEFSESLGGNSPHEQFTVVMLTYRREQVLLGALGHLYGLPYLNKVVVVWNTPEPPGETLQWPNVGVPVEVSRGAGLFRRWMCVERVDLVILDILAISAAVVMKSCLLCFAVVIARTILDMSCS